ncbi:hypothetical protein [Psychrobacillus antarcticus]|uniref:hypothetical protein n=1 Tax=Psychrobacillus antarcticus TaxID=2879115 RepID=UPI00240798A5|nr:hypothetical protein [Psychrobacillus antarcticus]
MKKISVIFLLLLLSLTTVFYVNWESSTKAKFAETNENTVLATLSAKVTTTFEEHGTPISNSRIIVINSLGEIIGTELTNSDGEAKIPVSVYKDPRFLMKNMGEVTVIAVANGYNEHINCPDCLKSGFHSIFHQIKFFDYCAFHPNQKLLNECINCNKMMPEYIINKGKTTAFHCSCGYSFLVSDHIKTVFKSWQFQPIPKERIIASWLELDKVATHKYSFIYPLNQYTKDFRMNKNEIDYYPEVAELFIAALNKEQENSNTVKITSQQNIFEMKSNYLPLQEAYKEVFSYRFTHFEFEESDQLDSIFFEVYKQTRTIYKSITRYILRKVIKDHHKCIKIFNRARFDGHVCPHALAFIFWKMECEGMNSFSEIESRKQMSKSYDFECVNEQFSVFPKGVFMTHLSEVLNSSSKEKGFNLLECNDRIINFIVNINLKLIN